MLLWASALLNRVPASATIYHMFGGMQTHWAFAWIVLLFSVNLSCCSMLCEGYWDLQRQHHSGFYCPRLTDPTGLTYCCHQGNHSLKYCCNQSEFLKMDFHNLAQNNTSKRADSWPFSLLAVGLYGILVLTLMIVDYLWFCKLYGLTVFGAIRKHLPCIHWVSNILQHRGSYGNRKPQIYEQQSSPSLHSDWEHRSLGRSFHGDQNTEVTQLDSDLNSERTECDIVWP
ncbi:protein shisa-like-1a [Erpetoichthys calabaricus]|uniref:protein shisa-like-1a n=1 Tax=Erpetoichthys calabaricus TaxID=27687 RepID=UPI002234974F|nr:protein shisa-like-1a [Erpetoichthys calabaricus]XP_051776813.1 protein shisa-like-1a [Erpetoichthys calabaricus]